MADHPVAVIGAGIVGAACALELAMAGHTVILFDRDMPGNGASFGNAGLVGNNAIVPMAFPGTLPKIPGWLVDPLGPVSVSPSRLVKGLPWFLRFALACSDKAAMRAAGRLNALNGGVIGAYGRLLGAAGTAGFL